ncbi:DUF4062 domain-containing protein [Janthinobacterium sp. P210005]|uniref:DUF4062 domain-containing protein n=1 Tax=Janthinobacterium sp. P210005 TaxID=3112938 RepID=UPI002E270003|nr:DUF4062 domain-containing protein [Janthinobacterium sp. P210005]
MRIFLSSTAYDLYDIRAFVIHELENDGHEVVYHENAAFPVHFGHSHDECMEAIKKCDVVVCILDRRYGGSYRGAGAPHIVDQKLKIKYYGKNGEPNSEEITIPARDLSITWCELITAFTNKMPVMTFARKRMLDEKETRRRNQEYKEFQTAYVENSLIFDLVDWITKQSRSNWIAGFDSIVDLRSMLSRWSAALKSEFVVNRTEENSTQIPSSHIAIVVEGENDRKFVKFLIEKLKLQSFFSITVGGGSSIVSNLRMMLDSQYGAAYDKVVVLADADLKDNFSKLNDRLDGENSVHIVFADPEIETWLVAGLDPDFFNSRAGNITRKVFLEHFGKMTGIELDRQLLHYDIEAAKNLLPELARFIELISDTESDRNRDIAE